MGVLLVVVYFSYWNESEKQGNWNEQLLSNLQQLHPVYLILSFTCQAVILVTRGLEAALLLFCKIYNDRLSRLMHTGLCAWALTAQKEWWPLLMVSTLGSVNPLLHYVHGLCAWALTAQTWYTPGRNFWPLLIVSTLGSLHRLIHCTTVCAQWDLLAWELNNKLWAYICSTGQSSLNAVLVDYRLNEDQTTLVGTDYCSVSYCWTNVYTSMDIKHIVVNVLASIYFWRRPLENQTVDDGVLDACTNVYIYLTMYPILRSNLCRPKWPGLHLIAYEQLIHMQCKVDDGTTQVEHTTSHIYYKLQSCYGSLKTLP